MQAKANITDIYYQNLYVDFLKMERKAKILVKVPPDPFPQK